MKKAGQHKKRKAAMAAPRAESEQAELDLIRRRLALPVEKRLNFLRKRPRLVFKAKNTNK